MVVSKLSPIAFLKGTGTLPENVNYALKSQYIAPLIGAYRQFPSCRSLRPLRLCGEKSAYRATSRMASISNFTPGAMPGSKRRTLMMPRQRRFSATGTV